MGTGTGTGGRLEWLFVRDVCRLCGIVLGRRGVQGRHALLRHVKTGEAEWRNTINSSSLPGVPEVVHVWVLTAKGKLAAKLAAAAAAGLGKGPQR